MRATEWPDGRIVSCKPTDCAGYWRAKSSGRLHRVDHVTIVWVGPNAARSVPRIVVGLVCRDLGPAGAHRQRQAEGLVVWPVWTNPCPRCFPGGDDDPHRPPKIPVRVLLDLSPVCDDPRR